MPENIHKPVLLAEVLLGLKPRPGGVYLDGTLGGTGHAQALLEASSPTGRLYGCDRDPEAVALAETKLARFAGRFEVRVGNFAELADWVEPESCDGILLDLGISSNQLDAAARGFSFAKDGPLDMRLNPAIGISAVEVVNHASANELAGLFWEFGQERNSRKIAREIERMRAREPIRTTRQLAGLIERILPPRGDRTHPATRVFLALRIHTNQELDALRVGLQRIWGLLKQGGRIGIITFHSIEDRMVKEFGRALNRDYRFEGIVDVPELRRPARREARWVNSKPIVPSPEELAANARARSAQLRILEKL